MPAQNLHWAAQNEVSLVCSTRVLAYGLDGSLVNAGIFQGTMDLDPGPGTDIYTSQNSTADVFVQKLDSNGNYMWGRTWEGAPNEDLQGLVVDDSGNVYLAGTYGGGWDADPGMGVANLTGRGYETFVVKLDSNGDFLWAVTTENQSFSGETRANGLELDSAGNLLVAGSFRYTVDFDPGAGVDSLSNVTNGGTFPNCFLWRIDPTGNHLDVLHTVAGASSTVSDLQVDLQGNILISGTFIGTADFDPSPGFDTITPPNFQAYYLQKLDPAGNLLWVQPLAAYIAGVETDDNGDLYLVGFFGDTVDFDPGPGIENLVVVNGNLDGYIVKWNGNGSFVWKGQLGGTSLDETVDVEAAPNGNILVLGGLREALDLDPGPGVALVTSPNNNEKAFVVNLSPNGSYNWGWAIDPQNLNPVRPRALAVSSDSVFAVAGDFSGDIDFDPGPATALLSSPGGLDGFVVQFADTSSPATALAHPNFPAISIYPNPSSGRFHISSSEPLRDCRLSVYDLRGSMLFTHSLEELTNFSPALDLAPGFYLVQLDSRGAQTCLPLVVR